MANKEPESETPLLDELEKGPWPSFVEDIKMAAKKNPVCGDLLRQLELSYKEKIGHWKHGGIVGITGYGSGVIGRYSDRPDLFPGVRNFHTMRVNQPSGWFYTTERLRKICDIWEKFGSGLTNMHGSTGDIILLGTTTENLQPLFDELSAAGFDLGGSGSALRTPSACVGMARCEWACFDTLQMCHDMTVKYQSELHRPMWPYKFKMKFSGCGNDCVASIARSDLAFIGRWRDDIQVNKDAVKEYAAAGLDIRSDVVELCPKKCIAWDDLRKEISINNEDCVCCMHCLNVMPKALKTGKDKGATLLIGGKAPILKGAQLCSVIIPFMEQEKLQPPYEFISDLLERIWDWWDENGKMRERVGELIDRVGMRVFLRAMDMKPIPQMVNSPRDNPYFFWWPEELGLAPEESDEEDSENE